MIFTSSVRTLLLLMFVQAVTKARVTNHPDLKPAPTIVSILSVATDGERLIAIIANWIPEVIFL